MFTQLDWDAIAEHVPVIGGRCTGSSPWNHTQELYVGLRFKDKSELKNAMKLYSIDRNLQYKVVESNKDLWVVKCANMIGGCRWMLRGRLKNAHGHFEVSRYVGPHTCLDDPSRRSQDHSSLDCDFIAREIYGVVKAQSNIKPVAIAEIIRQKYGYEPSYTKCWDAKQKAIAMIFGDWDISYRLLPKWLKAVRYFMPGSVSDLQTIPIGVPDAAMFDRVFWAFAPSIKGFEHCRPVLSIDAAHLYGKYKERLLMATGLDANEQIYPLAFAIVYTESYETWSWFLRCIRHYVTKRQGICIVSDRHAGIIKAVEDRECGFQPPDGYHRYCLRHFKSNFNEEFKDVTLKNMVWNAGVQRQPRKFELSMKRIEQLNKDAARWLQRHDPQK